MRAFIAIDVPENIKEKVIEFQKDLKKSEIFLGGWTKAYHYTLKFLGDVPEKKIEEIKKLQFKTKEFELEVKGFGAFPSEKFIRVIWIGADSMEIKNLQKEIENKLEPLGFERDAREFNGHLTLCRVKKFYKKEAGAVFNKHKNKSFGKFKVNSIKLIESKLSPTGPSYKTIKEFRFTS